jgi:hypothetical protein
MILFHQTEDPVKCFKIYVPVHVTPDHSPYIFCAEVFKIMCKSADWSGQQLVVITHISLLLAK